MQVSNFSSWWMTVAATAAASTSTTAFVPRSQSSSIFVASLNPRPFHTCSTAQSKDGTCLPPLAHARGGGGGGTTPVRMSSITTEEEAVAAVDDDAEEVVVQTPVEVFRNEYAPLDLIVAKINMDFQIFSGKTYVESELTIQPNPKLLKAWNSEIPHDLILDGDETSVTLLDIQLNGRTLTEGQDYEIIPGGQKGKLIVKNLVVPSGDEAVVLTTKVSIVPEDNTQLSGLYQSEGPMYCTQCEALGFRRITYYPDRPDNVSFFFLHFHQFRNS